LPDPKDRIHLLQQLKTASAAFFAADYETAIVEFKATLDEDPTMPTAWEWLGRSQRAAGRPVEALESFEMVTSLGAGDATVDRTMAALALEVGQLDVAAAAANRLMTIDPLPARSVLARVALGQGRPDDAISFADRILADAPESAEAHLIRGEALALKGDLQGALDAARAASADPAAEAAALVLGGRVLMIAGQVAPAQDNFRLALESDPTMLSAYTYLAASHLVQREVPPAMAALTAMVQRNPSVAAELRAIETLESFGLTAQAEQWRAAARQRHPGAAGQIR
jgi:tetratricopeptide (TPR) repeat protein